jgi:predicted GTPase
LGYFRTKKFKSLVPIYLRGAKILVIVEAITDPQGVDDVNVWYDLANEDCPGAAKVLVVNKTDLEGSVETVSRDAFNAKAAELGIEHIFYVSAETGEGIETLKNGLIAIAHEAGPRTEATAFVVIKHKICPAVR